MQRIQDMFINMEEVAEDAYKNTELLLSQYTKVMFRICLLYTSPSPRDS